MKYYESSLTVDFIKGELYKTAIPTCKAWHEGHSAIKGNIYITGNSLMRATKTVNFLEAGVYIDTDGNILNRASDFLIEISDYYWGDSIKGVTVNYKSNSRIWNRLDHYYLGMYLRWRRELFEQDLMYGYNCWDGGYLNHTIKDGLYVPLQDGMMTLTAPISPDRHYTLWGDSPSGCLISIGYSDDGELLNDFYYEVTKASMLRRNTPIIIKPKNIGDNLSGDGIKEYMTLFVQMPIKAKGMFLMEGNYNECVAYYGEEPRIIKTTIDNTTDWNIACTDRVVEGISGHIINGMQYKNSIAKIQKALSSQEWESRTGWKYHGSYKEGIWDKSFQQWLVNRFGSEMTINGTSFKSINNFNGECVKEVEQRIKEVMGSAV